MDDNGSGSLDPYEFNKAISDFGIEVTAALDYNDTADLMVTITKNFL